MIELRANTQALERGLKAAAAAVRRWAKMEPVQAIRVARVAMIMTAGMPLMRDPNQQVCQDCRGKGFDLQPRGRRHSRRCQRCRGNGTVRVGSTKR